jgi:C4-dicarboxylate-specific signal transduction histidine kinase
MSFEPFLAFFIIRYLRKSIRAFSNAPNWYDLLTIVMYGIIALAIIQVIFKTSPVTIWIWYALLFTIVAIILKYSIFEFAKKTLYAVLPLILLGFFSELLKLIKESLYRQIENYIDFAFAVALTWMIATIIKSNKQQKALEIERKKTKEVEEREKFVSAQKDELELKVNERTAELVQQKEELQHTLTELREAQALLIQSEKMASLGELTAGIAHEIQNPLNFVNNFSEVNTELLNELKSEVMADNKEEAISIANDIIENEQKINHHGKRADSIVKGMLQHSRTSSGTKEPTEINALADEYLRLSYHGLRAKDKSFNATMRTDFDETIGKMNIVSQNIGRVLLNLFNNAFYAVSEKKKLNIPGYEPTVSVSTRKLNNKSDSNKIEIIVKDNGSGIPQKALDKIFQPFFTTKPTGEGTGLGLSLSYDIIKAHGGEIKVENRDAGGASFIVILPL